MTTKELAIRVMDIAAKNILDEADALLLMKVKRRLEVLQQLLDAKEKKVQMLQEQVAMLDY